MRLPTLLIHAITALTFLSAQVESISAQQSSAEPVDIPPPAKNQPWKHEKTDLRLPYELAGLMCETGTDYRDPASGISFRYVNRKLRVRADVYVYPCEGPVATIEEKCEAVRQEAGKVLAGIRQAAKQGHYSQVKEGDGTLSTFDLLPKSLGKSCMIEFGATYVIHEESLDGRSSQGVISHSAIMIYQDHFVKVRCTFPEDVAKEGGEVKDNLLSKTRLCLLEPGIREEMKKHLLEYQEAPLSQKGREAAGVLMTYADASPVLHFSISSKVMLPGSELESVFPEANVHLLGAYVAGMVAASLAEPRPAMPDMEQCGALEMVRVFEAMKKEKPGLQSPAMDALAKAASVGKGGEWLREKDSRERKSGL